MALYSFHSFVGLIPLMCSHVIPTSWEFFFLIYKAMIHYENIGNVRKPQMYILYKIFLFCFTVIHLIIPTLLCQFVTVHYTQLSK